MSVEWRRRRRKKKEEMPGKEKKTIFDCLWVKADSSRQGGLQRLAGGAVSKSQPLLYP